MTTLTEEGWPSLPDHVKQTILTLGVIIGETTEPVLLRAAGCGATIPLIARRKRWIMLGPTSFSIGFSSIFARSRHFRVGRICADPSSCRN
jgi:hypothetical protein